MNHKKSTFQRPSAQLRLTPKVEMNNPAFKPPVDMKCSDLLSPPYTPRSQGGYGRKTDSSVDELVTLMKQGKPQSQSPKVTSGINDHQNMEMFTDSGLRINSGKNIEEVFSESEASIETIKITANLGDGGKRKVKIRNVPKWNGKQVYDPFASYHEELDEPNHNKRAVGKPKKSSVHFGPSTLLCSSNSNSPIENVDESNKSIKEDEEFTASEGGQKSQAPLSPPLTPRMKSNDSKAATTLRRPNFNVCICLRALKLVLCTHCEYTFYGRLKKNCKSHPNDIYELDIDACPKCNEKNMDGLKECDLPQEMRNISNKLVTN